MGLRDILIKNVEVMFPTLNFVASFQQLIDGIRPGTWNAVVPIGATASNAVNIVVDRAMMEGWITSIVAEIPRNPSNRAELDLIAAQLSAQVLPTIADPFAEVLLESNRPFANRSELRQRLRTVCDPGGSPLLLVRGGEKSGKSYSFYFAQHVARQRNYVASLFDVGKLVSPDHLAADILERIGVTVTLKEQGVESAERWAEKLADQVRGAIEARQQPRLLVFDAFPRPDEPSLPKETYSFIVRLVRYADEELHSLLRVVLIQFTADLPSSLEDVAERDEAIPFTGTDMLAVLNQVAKARGWDVSETALQTEIAALEGKALRERFKFLKETIQRLARASAQGVPP